jgi:hypothetical protein
MPDAGGAEGPGRARARPAHAPPTPPPTPPPAPHLPLQHRARVRARGAVPGFELGDVLDKEGHLQPRGLQLLVVLAVPLQAAGGAQCVRGEDAAGGAPG